jgi:hypothetical protein
VASPAYEKSVFLNCPFDDSFAPLLHAAVLTIFALGFFPRSARETEGEADPRIDRIHRTLQESKYSIHDLSRFRGEGPENLSRFNMPLELGMALSLRYQRRRSKPHNWVALVPPDYMHHKFISDLAAFDSQIHEGTPETIIRAISDWLKKQNDFSRPAPSPITISAAYPELQKLLEKGRETRWVM